MSRLQDIHPPAAPYYDYNESTTPYYGDNESTDYNNGLFLNDILNTQNNYKNDYKMPTEPPDIPRDAIPPDPPTIYVDQDDDIRHDTADMCATGYNTALYERPARELVKLYSLDKADPELLSTSRSRFTTNAISLGSWFSSIRSTVDNALRAGVDRPGALAIKSMGDYATEFTATVSAQHSTTAAVAIGS